MNETGWPQALTEAVADSQVAHLATLSRPGAPVCWPMTPYPSLDGRAIEFSTGVTYPLKAERARRNPRVGFLIDPADTQGRHGPILLVQGLATVSDADLQANTDRYVKTSLMKTGKAWRGQPAFLVRMQTWYWVRVMVRVTPLRVLAWPPEGGAPSEWRAPEGTLAPASDPAPRGSLGRWQDELPDWRIRAARAVARLGLPVISVKGADGFPFLVRALGVEAAADGFELQLPSSLELLGGLASASFQAVQGDGFEGQENATFAGRLIGARFIVERALPDFSLPAKGFARYANFFRFRRRLQGRVKAECRRRGQPVPKIRLPAAW